MKLRADAKVELIRRSPLFENCSRRDLGRIARIAAEQRIDDGAVLMREGEPGDAFFVVVEGAVEVRRRGRVVRRLEAGGFVGEIALLSNQPRTATVVAVGELRALVVQGEDFVRLLDELPELWLKVARALADRVAADEAVESR